MSNRQADRIEELEAENAKLKQIQSLDAKVQKHHKAIFAEHDERIARMAELLGRSACPNEDSINMKCQSGKLYRLTLKGYVLMPGDSICPWCKERAELLTSMGDKK